jgi:hypothetical protein
MPVSRLRKGHAARTKLERVSRINFFTEAGSLLYNRLISAVTGIRYDYTMEIVIEREARATARRARMRGDRWKAAGPNSQEAKRRLGQHLVQHPSVIARFAQHPTQADIARAVAEVEASGTKPSLGKRILNRLKGETEVERHDRLQAARRDALTLETA